MFSKKFVLLCGCLLGCLAAPNLSKAQGHVGWVAGGYTINYSDTFIDTNPTGKGSIDDVFAAFGSVPYVTANTYQAGSRGYVQAQYIRHFYWEDQNGQLASPGPDTFTVDYHGSISGTSPANSPAWGQCSISEMPALTGITAPDFSQIGDLNVALSIGGNNIASVAMTLVASAHAENAATNAQAGVSTDATGEINIGPY